MSMHDGNVRRLLVIQTSLVAGVTGIFFVLGGLPEAQSALYGGLVALLSAGMLGRGIRLAAEAARSAPDYGTRSLYLGAVQRFVIVLALFAAGMGWLGLSPLPLIVGFAVAQAAFVIEGTMQGFSSSSDRGAGR